MKSISKAVKLLLFVTLHGTPSNLLAFPEYIRKGYSSCRSCHIQTNGGGPLTAYGRTIAGDDLSTFGDADKGGLFYGAIDLPPSIDLAGDFRYLAFKYDDPNIKMSQKFWMQKEVSLVLKPADNVTLVASTGYYGYEPKDTETRRYFALITADAVLFRVGRFIPTWGLNIQDHTKGVKELFGQGKETFNVEMGYTHKYFEFVGTRILGGDSKIEGGDRPIVKQEDDKDGYSASLTLNLFKGAQVGAGFVELEGLEKVRRYTTYHVFLGNPWLYGQYEYQSHPDDQWKAYGALGVQAFKGFHIKAELDQDKIDREVFGTLQWFPYPHWDLMASFSDRSQIFVAHYYL